MVAPARATRPPAVPTVRPTLVATSWQRRALVAIAAGVAVVAVLGALVYHGTSTPFDTWVFQHLSAHVGDRARIVLAGIVQPEVSVVVLFIVALGAVQRRRFDVLALTVLAPVSATVIAEVVLKPLIGRLLGPHVLKELANGAVHGSYPSGHTTWAASTTLVLFIALCQLGLRPATRRVCAVVLTLWVLTVATALVANFYHYATDTFGAMGLSVAVVLTLALAIDRVALERASRRIS